MIRTIISLDPEDKSWLDRRAEEENMTMTQLVRTAIRHYRTEVESGRPPLDHLLQETSGIWKNGDGLAYQQKIRQDWEEEP